MSVKYVKEKMVLTMNVKRTTVVLDCEYGIFV